MKCRRIRYNGNDRRRYRRQRSWNADAQFNPGYQYFTGEGVDQDYDKAFQLFQMSAEQGLPVAMFAYGDCHYLGNGVEQNLETAKEWYQKALDAGYEPDETDQQHLKGVMETESEAEQILSTEE